MTDDYNTLTMKVVLIGDSGVGKTTLINRYVVDTFDAFEPPTISGGFRKKNVKIDALKTQVSLQIWDTAGQEKFKAIVGNYYKDAQCAIVVYDITAEESFEAARNWIEEVKEKAPEGVIIHLCGSKSDLEDTRRISLVEGYQMAKEYNWLFGETSAKKNVGVHEVFENVAKAYAESSKGKGKSDPNQRRMTLQLDSDKNKDKKGKWKC